MRRFFYSILMGVSMGAVIAGPAFAGSGAEKADQVATPIPPAGTGTIELKEMKPTMTVDVKASQARVFKTNSKIVRIAVSDPSIAEPVVVSDREFILLGKSPGDVSLFVWCE